MTRSQLALAVLATGLVSAPGHAPQAAESAAVQAAPSLVDVAAADPRFKTLVGLLSRAGLVDTLKEAEALTVFAPTNEAFARVPKDTLASLLRDGNEGALRRVLLHHVLDGRVRAGDILRTRSAEALSGEALAVGLRIGNANVLEADIPARNGVIHAIDRVLVPAPAAADAAGASRETGAVIREAIERGVPLYNDGNPEACRAVYANAARSLLLPEAGTAPLHVTRLRAALAADGDASDRAWALRRAFDGILADLAFEPRMEASLPEGFPGAGPVGRVVEKRYPSYRAARTSGGNEFWRLFNHIKSNDVQMTAPVEMTMSDGMRAVDMAFLYEHPSQGRAGSDGSVEVVDVPATTVLSIGMRGGRGASSIAEAKQVLEAALASRGEQAAGPFRVLGYNSPMVPNAKRFWELQVPIR